MVDYDALEAAGIPNARKRAGQIPAASDVRDALPNWPAVSQDPLVLKGFDAPVTAYDLHGGR